MHNVREFKANTNSLRGLSNRQLDLVPYYSNILLLLGDKMGVKNQRQIQEDNVF